MINMYVFIICINRISRAHSKFKRQIKLNFYSVINDVTFKPSVTQKANFICSVRQVVLNGCYFKCISYNTIPQHNLYMNTRRPVSYYVRECNKKTEDFCKF